MFRFRYLLILFALTVMAVQPAAGTGTRREAAYTIHSKGLRVGDLRIVTAPLPSQGGERLFRFQSTTNIDADFLFCGVKSQGMEEAVVGKRGTLRYQKNGTENDRKTSVSGEFDGSAFTLKFSDCNGRRTEVFKRESYDFTTMDCPEMTLKKEGEQAVVRLLDLEHGRVVTRRYRWIRSEDVRVGERTVRCRVIDFEDPDNRCRRWVTSDEMGILITRQEGKGTSGSYVLKISTLNG